jgi:hypothetical protein
VKILDIDHRAILIQGWITMGFLFAGNLILDTIRCNTGGSCAEYYEHFGNAGLKMITTFMLVYALMPLYIRVITNRKLRYAITPFTMFITMSYLAHEIGHLAGSDGGKPFGWSHIPDILHHVIGISMAYVAVNWVQQGKREAKEKPAAALRYPAKELVEQGQGSRL